MLPTLLNRAAVWQQPAALGHIQYENIGVQGVSPRILGTDEEGAREQVSE